MVVICGVRVCVVYCLRSVTRKFHTRPRANQLLRNINFLISNTRRMAASTFLQEFSEILRRPFRLQIAAMGELRLRTPKPVCKEVWNTAMSRGSLYDAWSHTTIMCGLYAANKALIRQYLDALQQKGLPFKIVEVGGMYTCVHCCVRLRVCAWAFFCCVLFYQMCHSRW